jgi:hypothetical protein
MLDVFLFFVDYQRLTMIIFQQELAFWDFGGVITSTTD